MMVARTFVTTSSYLSLSSLYSCLVLSKITITNSQIACSRVQSEQPKNASETGIVLGV